MIFKPDEGAPEEDCLLQAALSAQVRKTIYENWGAAVQDRNEPKQNPIFKTSKIWILGDCEIDAISSWHVGWNGLFAQSND